MATALAERQLTHIAERLKAQHVRILPPRIHKSDDYPSYVSCCISQLSECGGKIYNAAPQFKENWD